MQATADALATVAKALVSGGRGILAADESDGTIAKRFDKIGVENTEENRRSYRRMLFTTEGMPEFISGVILFDETIRQTAEARGSKTLVQVIVDQGMIPGIKVDKGAKPLANAPGETITEGLDGLRARLIEYGGMGAKFAKWRAVISIDQGRPTQRCIDANAEALARYAALCQEEGLVPMVEPEVLMDGDHGIGACFDATERTLHAVFDRLYGHGVYFEGMLLKVNMVVPGSECKDQVDARTIAEQTLACLRRTVPAAVPGIVFLSGGQSDTQATVNLDAINRMGQQPWPLSFSYGRALQAAALTAWNGKPANIVAAQKQFYRRAKCTSAAARGRYEPAMESQG